MVQLAALDKCLVPGDLMVETNLMSSHLSKTI
jgi:hypothetical protein